MIIRILKKLAMFFAVSAIIYLFYFTIFKTDKFHIKNIEIKGNNFTKSSDIKLKLKDFYDCNIFKVSFKKLATSVYEFPFVKKVSISTSLPDTVVVTIEEIKPKIIVSLSGKLQFADKNGKIFAPWAPINDDLPVLAFETVPEQCFETKKIIKTGIILWKELIANFDRTSLSELIYNPLSGFEIRIENIDVEFAWNFGGDNIQYVKYLIDKHDTAKIVTRIIILGNKKFSVKYSQKRVSKVTKS